MTSSHARPFVRATLIVAAVLGICAARPASAGAPLQTPSVVFDEGRLLGIKWQTGARKSRDLGRGRPCFWIRVRLEGDVELPHDTCQSPRGFPMSAVGAPASGGRKVWVQLLVGPREARAVRLHYRGAPDPVLELLPAPAHATLVGLKRNFRYATRAIKGAHSFDGATFYDEDGEVLYETPGA